MIYLIVFLALRLRLVNLNQSLWLDEAVQAITAKESFSSIFTEILGDFHPPLYHFLVHFWVRIFGSSEIALRMPSVLFGVGTVYFGYKIAMYLHGRKVGILAGVLMATAPFHVYYSQEARMYSMAGFFAVASIYFLLKIEESKRKKFLYFLFTLLMLYTDYFGFLVLLAQIIYLLIKRKYKFIILNSIFIILCFIPWLPMFIKQIITGMLATKNLPGWAGLVNVSFLKALPLTLIKFTIGRITIFNKTVYGIISLGLLGLLGGLGYKIYKNYKSYKEREKEVFNIVLLWFLVPLLISWILSLVVPNFQPFRLLLILPAFYLILTEGLVKLKTKQVRLVFSGIFLLINIISLAGYFFNPYFHREDWRELVKYLNQQNRPKVILPSSASAWPIEYYDGNHNITLITGVSGALEKSDSFNLQANKKDEVYYIRYLVDVFDPQEKILAGLNRDGFVKTKELSFNQLFVLKFEKR